MTEEVEQTTDEVAALRTRLQEAINATLPAVESNDTKDEQDKAGDAALTRRAKAEIQTLVESNRDKRVNRHLRWKYARWVFCYLVCYSVFCAVAIALNGFGPTWFIISPIVLTALVGSTAVSAIGLVASVVSGLFKST